MFSKASKIISILAITSIILTGCSSNTKNNNEDSIPNLSVNENIESASSSSNLKIEPETNLDKATDTKLNDVKVTFLNTGNSDSILINDNGKYLLIDSGDNDDEKFMSNYLDSKGIDKLDYLIISHWDADHVGGADAVVDSVKIDTVLVPNGNADTKTYRDFITSISNAGLSPSVPLEGAKFELSGSYFEVFNTDGGNSKNDDSLVVKLTNGEDTFLFTGDAGTSIENKISNKIGDVDVLKVGHHGSHSSTGYEFIDAIRPEYGVILCDANNKYGHPHKEPLEVLSKFGVELHRSDECGEIEFLSSGAGVTTDCKEGSYNPGKNSKYSSQSSLLNTSKNYNSDNYKKEDVSQETTEDILNGNIVYWTPNGKSYHSTKDCSTLSRSKTILSGTQAESGKNDPCDRCN